MQWVLSYIEMNQPWIYMCSPSQSPLPTSLSTRSIYFQMIDNFVKKNGQFVQVKLISHEHYAHNPPYSERKPPLPVYSLLSQWLNIITYLHSNLRKNIVLFLFSFLCDSLSHLWSGSNNIFASQYFGRITLLMTHS